MSLFAELKRRNVIRVGGAYLALGWVVTQITSTIAPVMHMPEWVSQVVVWVGVIAFPFVLLFSWAYELTPEGLKRESEVDRATSVTHVTARRLDLITIGLVVAAVAVYLLDPMGSRQRAESPPSAQTAANADSSSVAAPIAVAPGLDDKSIAVLPFVNMSSDQEQEYFSDGISEELLNLLAKIPELRVIARTSSFAYKGTKTKVEQVAQELHVAHVLEGSVRKAGNTVRITAQLIRASDSSHLWSETYDRKLDDIFAVQDEIAAAVVEQLKIELLGAAPKAKEVNPEAYALYLQARQVDRQRTPEGYEQAILLYQQVLALDPVYAAAWDGLARIYISQAGNGLRPIAEGQALAREAVAKALALDPEFAPAHARLGRIAMNYDGDLAAAAGHNQHALALAPADPDILRSAAVLASSIGRLDQAIALDEYVVAHDPVNPAGHANLGLDYLGAHRPDEAVASLRRVLRLAPGYITAHFNVGLALLEKGQGEAALGEMQQEPSELWRLVGLPMVYRTLGRHAESDAAMAELIGKFEKDAAYNISYVLAYRKEADRAFEWLDKAVAYKDVGLAEIVVEPLFANIHSDPRWLPFLRKLGRAPEQLAAIQFEVKLPQ